MALSDYAHWNEEARMVWWLEEGRHESNVEPDYDDEPYAGWDDWEDFEEDEVEAEESTYWQAEDAAMESSLFGDC